MKRTIALAMALVLASMAGTNAFAATAADVDLPEGWVIYSQFTPDGKPPRSDAEYATDLGLELDSFSQEYEQKVFELTNQEREEAGLPPLSDREDLNEEARIRAKELVEQYSHERPDGTMAGWENISRGDVQFWYNKPESVMAGWMNSDGHRYSILHENAESMGVGCYVSPGGGIYWVQCFGIR